MKKGQGVPRELADLGYERPTMDFRETLYMSLNGYDKSGKTDFALRHSPEPIGIVDINKGLDGVVQKFMAKKDIFHKPIQVSKDQQQCIQQFGEFQETWRSSIGKELVKTFVVDNFGELYDLATFAEFGGMKPRGRAYGPLFSLLNEMLDMPLAHNVHVILIHNLKAEYKGDDPTGDNVLRGYSNVPHKVQINADIKIENKVPVLTIRNSRFDLDHFGHELRGENASFVGLGRFLYGPHWEAE